MITLAITTYNRIDLTLKSFEHVLNDDRISEIVIVDDCSTDNSFLQLNAQTHSMEKVKLYQNEKNIGCYHNKRRAVELSSNDWVILFDSDNVIKPDYLDALGIPIGRGLIYAPCYAKPHFDYRHFARQGITKEEVRDYIHRKNFDCLINTCNYVVNRAEYLRIWQDHPEPWTADTLFFNYCWLKAGNSIYVVPGMEYEHKVDNYSEEGSHYQTNVRKTGNFANEIMKKLKAL